MFAFFYVLKLLGYFRVNAADEAAGLDASHHGGSAYPLDLDDDASHKGSSYNGNQSGYNKVCACSAAVASIRVCQLCCFILKSVDKAPIRCMLLGTVKRLCAGLNGTSLPSNGQALYACMSIARMDVHQLSRPLWLQLI